MVEVVLGIRGKKLITLFDKIAQDKQEHLEN